MDMSEYIIKGFTHTFDPYIEELIGELPPMEEWKGESYGGKYPEGVDLLPAQEYILEKYVKPNFRNPELGYRAVWTGIDRKTVPWHNDLPEGPNIFFMYYLTDITEGGELCFKVRDEVTGCIQPKRHMLLLGSQEPHIMHKVNLTDQIRTVCNFGYIVEWI